MTTHDGPTDADRLPDRGIGFEAGILEVLRRIAASSALRPVVAITGPVGAGKSTLAERIAAETGGRVVSTDRYLPSYDGLPVSDRDRPEHADLGRLAADLLTLERTGAASLPIWSFHAHRRVGEERVTACGPIVCEGLFALYPAAAPTARVRVFVHAPAGTRWERWERIEQRGERGWGVEAARQHFESVAEPTFCRYRRDYLARADLVITNDRPF